MPERYLGQPLGKYRVETLLGSGGFAWVFKGHDPELDIPVAIKVLKPQFAGDATLVERFRREASTAARLRHPNIIKIYSVGREGDAVFFVMDYLPGGLADRLEATPSLPEDYVMRIGIDVARALGFAHREGVIHRDIKVDNILFDPHGNAVVADFGIARAVSGYTHQTGTNMVVGTPQYFAPEQARAKPLDGRADVYSLGVTLFRAVTGRLPFEGDDWYEIARQHVEEPAPPPRSINPDVSPEFERILLRCLAKAPEERPATGEQLAEELERILTLHRDPGASRTVTVPATETPTLIAPVTATRRTPVRRHTSARMIVPGALVLVGATVAGFLLLASRQDGGASPAPLDSTAVTDTSTTDTVASAIDTPDSGSTVGRRGGRATRPDSGARGRPLPVRGSLVFTVPSAARVAVNGVNLPDTVTRLDTLPGTYTITARLTSIQGCPTSIVSRPVDVRAGASENVTLTPRPCGWLQIEGEGRRDNRRVDGLTRYQVFVGSSRYREGILPLSEPLVLPVGTYDVVVTQAYCQDHWERSLTISAEQRAKVGPAFLFCRPP